jgi:hypothetical protein
MLIAELKRLPRKPSRRPQAQTPGPQPRRARTAQTHALRLRTQMRTIGANHHLHRFGVDMLTLLQKRFNTLQDRFILLQKGADCGRKCMICQMVDELTCLDFLAHFDPMG